MKYAILLAILTVSLSASSQTFKTDWNDFSMEQWEVSFSDDTIHSFFNENKIGEVIFKDSTFYIAITYYVYPYEEIDSNYFEVLENWKVNQSQCSFPQYFKPFKRGDFYYEPYNCNKCAWQLMRLTHVKFKDNSESYEEPQNNCDALVKKLTEYIKED
ncbi:MAG: hypothetical protein ACJA0U_002665 [Salibacteraceae bacterium]|jgi:hypothetical protein